MGKIGGDLRLPALVAGMLASAEAWDAVASFCDDVMSRKEAAEWAREVDPNAPAERRCRRGGRRRRFLQGRLYASLSQMRYKIRWASRRDDVADGSARRESPQR